MSWTTSASDLRKLLADDTLNRFCYRKKVFGALDGVNMAFKTFEPRRVTNFSTVAGGAAPLGLYLNGTVIASTDVTSDDPTSGEVILKTPPPASAGTPARPSVLVASYYYQWFLDTELANFLTSALNALQLGSDITQVPQGLQPAVLHYAASDAFRMISSRWAERASNAFLLEDAPKKEALGLAGTFTKQADSYAKRYGQLRDDYYQRSGQPLAPNFRSSWGCASAVTPRR